MTPEQRPVREQLLQALASLRLTMFLLIALAIVSIIGTVIPQGQLPPEYLAHIGGEQSNRFKLYSMLGFFDMYHAWWFQGLLGMLSLNLLVCTIKRLPHVWQIATKPEVTLNNTREQAATCRAELSLAAAVDRAAVIQAVTAAAGTPVVTEQDGQLHLFVQRRPWARLAVYVVHASIILIFIGAIIGNIFGFKGFVTIPEGTTVSTFTDRQGKERPLGFELRCDQFAVSYYPTQNPGQQPMPKEFKSILTLTENGAEVPGYKHARIIVNEPLTYKGITFYQSSYGTSGTHNFRVGGPQGGSITASGNKTVYLPDGSSMHVIEAVQEVSPFIADKSGPAAKIDIHPASGGKEVTLLSFANHPEDNRAEAARAGVPVITYLGGNERYYTGLQVNKDPGVWVVWSGCILICVGLYVAFFMPHQRFWFRLSHTTLTLAGHTTRNQAAFKAAFDHLAEQLHSRLNQEETP